jgi:RNA-splicing ligase RtcB
MRHIDLMNSTFDVVRKKIEHFPFSKTYVSTLGGESNASVMVTVGLDKKESWAHGIFENSRFVRYHITRRGEGVELECFHFHMRDKTLKKFRSVSGSIDKILNRLDKDIKVLESWL